MIHNKTFHRKKIVCIFFLVASVFLYLTIKLAEIMIGESEYYSKKAQELHERERPIKAARGRILDRNGVILADNKKVCTVSVVHAQLTDPEKVIRILCEKLDLPEDFVRKRVEKISSMERIKSNVEKEIGDRIREAELEGVKVDEDYKRYYPYDKLASKVLGFTGADNQGIIGLEVKYEAYLKGEEGQILTLTDAAGIEVEAAGEGRKEPVSGDNLVTTLDYNIQNYATQLAGQVMMSKEAERVSLLVMNPSNGEILAMADVPEFSLNDPFTLPAGEDISGNEKTHQDLLNKMWRNGCINDTYEPGSAFKVITAAAALESGEVTMEDTFHCPGYIVVEDRRIRCHKVKGHGSENFLQGTMNSCNPVFVTLGLRVGANRFYDYMKQFGMFELTGIDLPGEAGTIMHKKKDIGEVELATMSFGQSFQVTPIQLATTVSSLVNGGIRVVPHLAKKVTDIEGNTKEVFETKPGRRILSEETSKKLQYILEQVVENGTGKKAYVEGYRIGGKTATSQTLPRGSGKYIASFIGFAPANNPKVLALVVIHNPQGTYYGGQIAAPVIQKLFENILPYLQEAK